MLRLIFWPVLMPSFLFSVGIGAVAPVMVLAALSLGASPALASAIVAFLGGTALAVTVPVGIAIDKLGDKRAMLIATVTSAFFLAVTGLALAFPSRWSLAIFIGAGLLRTPAMVAWGLARQSAVASAVPAESRASAMTALGGAMRVGNLVGPMLGAALLLWAPLWSVYALCVVTALAATVLLYLRKLNQRFDAAVQQESAASAAGGDDIVGVRWKAVGLAGVSIICLAVARVGQPILVVLWGVHLGWSESSISLLVALGSAVEIALMVPGGYLKDRLGRSIILATCLTIYGAGFIVAPLWQTSVGLIVAVIVMSVGNGLGAGVNMTIGADLSPRRGRAKFLSIWAMFSQAGQLGGPLGISSLLLIANIPTALTCVGTLAIAGALWALATQPLTQLPTGTRKAATAVSD